MIIFQHFYFVALFSPGLAFGPLSLKFLLLPILSILFVLKLEKSQTSKKMLIIYFLVLCSLPLLSILQNNVIYNDKFRPSLYMNAYFYFNILYAIFGIFLFRMSAKLLRSLLYSVFILVLFLIMDVFEVDYSFFSDSSPTWLDYTERGKIYRPGGLSGDPNRAAISIIIIFILMSVQPQSKKFLNYSVLTLGLLTQSRTFIGSYILSFFSRLRVLHYGMVICLSSLVFYFLFQKLFTSIIFHKSMLTRYRYWGNLSEFDWISLFGNGLGSSLFVSLPYQYGPLHNSWMTIFYEMGVIGLVVYLVAVLQVCRRESIFIMLLPFTLTIDFLYSQGFLFILFFLLLNQKKVN